MANSERIYLIQGNDTDMSVCLRKGGDDPLPYDLTGASRIGLALTGHGLSFFVRDIVVSGEDNNIISGVLAGDLLTGEYGLEVSFVLGGKAKRFRVPQVFEVVTYLAEDQDGTAEGEGDGISITVTVQPEIIEIAGPTGPRGKSAYEVWLAEGHTGTVDDFFDWLAVQGMSKAVTHSELVALRDGCKLTAGAMYRITDYVATVRDNALYSEAKSANHPFDIIVTALDESHLSEECLAAPHEGDTYFANSDLSAWKIWYTIDNDTATYDWADPANGKGVIYRMIDEYANDLGYDFKGILIARHPVAPAEGYENVLSDISGMWLGTNSSALPAGITVDTTQTKWFYTFSHLTDGWDNPTDASLRKGINAVYNVTITSIMRSNTRFLSRNVFMGGPFVVSTLVAMGASEEEVGVSHAMHFRAMGDCSGNSFFGYVGSSDCMSQLRYNIFVGDFRHNRFATDVEGNTIVAPGDISFNDMWCENMVVRARAFIYNSGGGYTSGTVLKTSEYVSYNKFPNYFIDNRITATGSISNNDFGTSFYQNTFTLTGQFTGNKFTGFCYDNNIGCSNFTNNEVSFFHANTISTTEGVNACVFGPYFESNTLGGRLTNVRFSSGQTRFCVFNNIVGCTFDGIMEYVTVPTVSGKRFTHCDVRGGVRGTSSVPVVLDYDAFFLASSAGVTRRVTIEGTTTGKIVAIWMDGDAPKGVIKTPGGEWTDLGLVTTSGYYPDMRVGEAEYLPGTETDEVEGILTVAKSTGLARIKEVKGKSLVWNQQVKNGDFADDSNWIATGGTISAADNILTFTAGSSIAQASRIEQRNLNIISGHKYLVTETLKSSVDTKALIGFNTSPGMTFEQTALTANTKTTIKTIATASTDATNIYLYINRNTVMQTDDTVEFSDVMLIDLTQLFGSGSEPSTVAEFEAWLASNIGYRDYYAYDPGTIISNKTERLEITGLNQWDGEYTEEDQRYLNNTGAVLTSLDYRVSSYIDVLGNTGYYFKNVVYSVASAPAICWYDSEKNFISGVSGGNNIYNKVITSPINARYLRCSIYKATADISCVNISGSRNGQYGPYQKSEFALDLATLTGKLNGEGESVTIFPEGMRSAGTAYDSFVVDEDGWCRKAVINYHKKVLTGEETYIVANDSYIKSDATDAYITYVQIPITQVSTAGNVLCSHLVSSKQQIWNTVGHPDEITIKGTSSIHQIHLNISNNRTGIVPGTDTKATAKTKIAAYIAAQYAAGTPVTIVVWRNPLEYVLDTPIYMGIDTEQGGVIRQLPENGAAPTTAPMRMDIAYALLPEALISGSSLENLLKALKSANKISNYTMTYNATSGKWEFSIS